MKKTNNSMERFERKWVFDYIDYNQLSILLYRSKLFFSTQFQDREVNSIYFDDQNYSAIKQSVEGVSSKKKYRLRWYGNLNKITNSVFEVKKKKGFVIVPVAFVSEHSETLVELDIEYKKLAEKNGCSFYKRVPALGIEENFIKGLEELVLRQETRGNFVSSVMCSNKYVKCPCLGYEKFINK